MSSNQEKKAKRTLDPEVRAMAAADGVLRTLTGDALARVLAWLVLKHGGPGTMTVCIKGDGPPSPTPALGDMGMGSPLNGGKISHE